MTCNQNLRKVLLGILTLKNGVKTVLTCWMVLHGHLNRNISFSKDLLSDSTSSAKQFVPLQPKVNTENITALKILGPIEYSLQKVLYLSQWPVAENPILFIVVILFLVLLAEHQNYLVFKKLLLMIISYPQFPQFSIRTPKTLDLAFFYKYFYSQNCFFSATRSQVQSQRSHGMEHIQCFESRASKYFTQAPTRRSGQSSTVQKGVYPIASIKKHPKQPYFLAAGAAHHSRHLPNFFSKNIFVSLG